MNTPVIVKILQGLELVAVFLINGVQLAMQIKSHFELDPNFTVSVENLTGDAVSVDDATMDEINAWRQGVGLPALPNSGSTPPPPPITQ